MTTTSHRLHFDQELHELQDNLLRMASLVDSAIARALQSLNEQDLDLARQIAIDDARINEIRFKIEEQCLLLIAREQPVATDLRAIVAALSIAGEIERMGDHAAGIAKTVLRMGSQAPIMPLVDLNRMADESRSMLRTSLDSCVKRDSEVAQSVAWRDDVIDGLYQDVFRQIVGLIAEDPTITARAMYLLFAGHNLERIGDRCVNIAERVIFINSGTMKELSAGPDEHL
ncbi:MAG TPA: phosphate signaling complex protein PhoU [Anaerolineales bacterium]|nr:phosphate signaling complex protein PhoU [Anaerolineales bacterium]HRF47786.1 phosphate signaling complex protein PhoU [Anaerolineales bacterium]